MNIANECCNKKQMMQRSNLMSAFQLLIQDNNVQMNRLDRPNRIKFRKNIRKFVSEVRGMLKKLRTGEKSVFTRIKILKLYLYMKIMDYSCLHTKVFYY